MLEFTYFEIFIFITALWILVRATVCFTKGRVSWKREAQLLLVYTCFVVIARMVYFPFHLVDGHIDTLKIDSSQITPVWLNLIPIVHLFDIYDGWQINIIGNIAMFIPVGIVWPVCFKKLDTVGKATLAGFGFTLFIEISQLISFDHCSDIDDLFLNTVGAYIGACIYFSIKKAKEQKNILT